MPTFKDYALRAELLYGRHVVAHKQNRAAFLARYLIHFAEAFLLELRVADGEDFIDDEDVRLHMRGYRECEADIHAARVVLHGCIQEFLDAGEGDDSIKLSGDLFFLHAENGAVQEYVLAARELRVETGTDFEEGADAAAQDDLTFGGRSNLREYFEECGFAGTVRTDDADDFAALHREVHIFEGPEFFTLFHTNGLACSAGQEGKRLASDTGNDVAQSDIAATHMSDVIFFAEILYFNDWFIHICSAGLYDVCEIAFGLLEIGEADDEQDQAGDERGENERPVDRRGAKQGGAGALDDSHHWVESEDL